MEPMNNWRLTPKEAAALQRELRLRLVRESPPGFAPRLIGGVDISIDRFATTAFAGVVVIDRNTMETVEEQVAAVEIAFPYVPGLLAFRELPALEPAWRMLRTRPDALIFDGAGYAHPRRFGLACHGGMLFDVPSAGCAKSILIGTVGEMGDERGATAPLVDHGEVIGTAVRLRDHAKPVYVSAGHRMDLETAVQIVQSMGAGYREPETTRRAHRLVNEARKRGVGIG